MSSVGELKVPLSRADLTAEGLSTKLIKLQEGMSDDELEAMRAYLNCCRLTVYPPEIILTICATDPSFLIPVKGWNERRALEADNPHLKFAFALAVLSEKAKSSNLQSEYDDDLRFIGATSDGILGVVFPLTLPGLIAESQK